VRLTRVRPGRSNPGLAAQHLTAIRAIAELCGADVSTVGRGATAFDFRPRTPLAARYRWDVGTAGTITLVLQAVLPLALFYGVAVHNRTMGSRDVKAAPPIDYFLHVSLPLFAAMGANVSVRVLRRSYFSTRRRHRGRRRLADPRGETAAHRASLAMISRLLR